MKYGIRYLIFNKLRHLGLSFDANKSEEVQAMFNAIKKLKGGKIKFEFEFDENGNWAVESTNVQGIVTGGTFNDNIYSVINDAIFTYYSIPARFCDDSLLIKKSSKNKATKNNTAASHIYVYKQSSAIACA